MRIEIIFFTLRQANDIIYKGFLFKWMIKCQSSGGCLTPSNILHFNAYVETTKVFLALRFAKSFFLFVCFSSTSFHLEALWLRHNKKKKQTASIHSKGSIHSIKAVWSTRFVLLCPWKIFADWKEVRKEEAKQKTNDRNVFYQLSLFIWCSVIIFECCQTIGGSQRSEQWIGRTFSSFVRYLDRNYLWETAFAYLSVVVSISSLHYYHRSFCKYSSSFRIEICDWTICLNSKLFAHCVHHANDVQWTMV